VPERDRTRFRAAGIKQVLLICVMLSVQIVVFIVSAGHANDLRAWFFFSISFLHYSTSTAVQYKLNPELLAQRLRIKREGSKLWDEILMRTSNLVVLLVIPATAGFDIGRFHWSALDVNLVVIGLILLSISTILLNWAMTVNPFFEPTVRIQHDRDHTVVTSGPYKIVRHPGYLAGILFALSIPPIIGSAFTFIPVGLYCVLTITRTLLEDRTLQDELEGYSQYASQVRYRLIPGIW